MKYARKALRMAFLLSLFTASGWSQVLSPEVDSIPMRDGKKIAADVYLPTSGAAYPVILIQTPYNRLYYRLGLPLGIKKDLAGSPYAFVIIDWRCFYGSQSACVAQPNRGQDGYDVVEWIATQSWCNGKIGTWGPSALGKIQFQTAKENPPSLTCAVPLVAGSQFNYDEYYPGGCYRTEYVEQLDALGFGLSPLLKANPVKNLTWSVAEAANLYPASIHVPMLMIGGWYDHNVEVMMALFDTLKSGGDAAIHDRHRLVMGPWAHGGSGTAQVGTAQQGDLVYQAAAGWSDSLALAFLDYHLRGVANGWDATPEIRYFQMGTDTWLAESHWPPAGQTRTLYLHDDDTLRASTPANGNGKSFQYDPHDPSPTVGGPTLKQGLQQGPYDQAPVVENRGDSWVLSTPVLNEDLVIHGRVIANLFVSSDRTDTDICLRLTDVYPDERSMLVADQVLRMRFRNGYTVADTMLMTPGQVYPVEIAFPNTAITILKGHRLRFIITSANYPRFDLNLNNGGPMYTAG
ncbi:MAG: CocE/NonD family hydrolase, partial [Flavobacteriales bacterium]|nr:CocE/NonD family hydrolase [Flavobacteriales bacterium]